MAFLPIFTMGKYFERDGKRYLPFAIQDHSIRRTLAEILTFFDVEDETGILASNEALLK